MKALLTRAGLALVVTAAVAIPATASGSSSATVILKHMRFSPALLTVKRGSSVTFVWKDGSIPHNVTGPGVKTSTKTKGTLTIHMTRRGRFTYRCTVHPGMKVRITVR